MQRLKDYAAWLAIALCAAFLACSLAYPAIAQDITYGTGLLCDTEAQVERYVSLYKQGDDGNEVAKRVSAEAGNETACGILAVAFVEGEEVGKARGVQGPVRIIRIVVVGIQQPYGWMRVRPMVQFTLLPIKEEGA